MTGRVRYSFRTDKKTGEPIAYRTDIKTGIKRQIDYKTAVRRNTDLLYRRERRDIEKRLSRESAGGTFKEYTTEFKKVEREVTRKNRKGEYTETLTPAQIRSRAKKQTIRDRTGIACKYNYLWIYWLRLGTDEKGSPICDTTPVFEAGSLKRNGQRDYETMIEVCKDIYDKIQRGIKSGDICNSNDYKVQGGHCVRLYNKSDKSIIDRYQEGEGCGFAFDFAGYEKVR